jgi:hypothetical protein
VPSQLNGYDCGLFVCLYAAGLHKIREQLMTYSDVYSYQSPLLEKITLNSNFQFNQGVVNDFRHQLGALLDNLSSVYQFGVVPTGKKKYTKKRSHSVAKKGNKKCSGTKSSKRNSTKTMTPPAKIHRKLDLESDDNSVKDLLALDPFLPSPVQVLSTKAEAPNEEHTTVDEAVLNNEAPFEEIDAPNEEERTTVDISEAPIDAFKLGHESVLNNEAQLEEIDALNEEEHTTVDMSEASNDASPLVHEPVFKIEAPFEEIDAPKEEEHTIVEMNEAPNDASLLVHEAIVKNDAPLEKIGAPNEEEHTTVEMHMQPMEDAIVQKNEVSNDEFILAHEPVVMNEAPEKDEAPNDKLKPEACATIEKEEDHEDDGVQHMQPEEHPIIEKNVDHEDNALNEVDVPALSIRYRRRTSEGAKTVKSRKVLSSDTADEMDKKLPHDPLVGKTVAFARYTPVCMSLITQLGQKFDEKGMCYELDGLAGHIVGTVLRQNKQPPKSKRNVTSNYNVIWEYTAFGDSDLAAIVLLDGEKVGQQLVRKREQLKSKGKAVKKGRRRSKVEVLRAKFIKSNLTKVSDDEANQVSIFFFLQILRV